MVSARAVKDGWSVVHEPHIRTSVGIRIPDLVVYKSGESAVVVDATVVADNADLTAEHKHKVSKYDLPEIRSFVATLTGVLAVSVEFSSVTLSWRGALARDSSDFLTRVGFDQHAQMLLSIRCVEQGFQIYLSFQRSTYRRAGVKTRAPENR